MILLQYSAQLPIFNAETFVLFKQIHKLPLQGDDIFKQLSELIFYSNHLFVDIFLLHALGLTPPKENPGEADRSEDFLMLMKLSYLYSLYLCMQTSTIVRLRRPETCPILYLDVRTIAPEPCDLSPSSRRPCPDPSSSSLRCLLSEALSSRFRSCHVRISSSTSNGRISRKSSLGSATGFDLSPS